MLMTTRDFNSLFFIPSLTTLIEDGDKVFNER